MPDEFVGFDAEASLDDFSYKFPEKWGGDNERHEIPEPSNEQIAHYWTGFYIMASEGQISSTAPENETDEEREARLREVFERTEVSSLEAIEKRRSLLADLCSQEPSLDMIQKLPFRVLNAFEAYVQGKIRPEASRAATTDS